jgi:hypothetical protein
MKFGTFNKILPNWLYTIKIYIFMVVIEGIKSLLLVLHRRDGFKARMKKKSWFTISIYIMRPDTGLG